jgi:hypothetical protein
MTQQRRGNGGNDFDADALISVRGELFLFFIGTKRPETLSVPPFYKP